MNRQVRRPLWLALAASVCLHLLALTAPGWGLPGLDDDDDTPVLAARLQAPSPEAQPAVPVPPAPSPPRPAAKPRPAPEPVPVPVPAPGLAAEPVPDPTPSAPDTPPVEAATPSAEAPAAVPPAPTFFEGGPSLRWPRAGRLVFDVFRGEQAAGGLLVGQSVHAWQHDGAAYELRVTTETVGLAALFRPAQVEQVSRGGFDAQGLLPLVFESLRDGQRKESARFDRAQGRIFLGNGRSDRLQPGAQDLVALFHQLGLWRGEVDRGQLQIATGRKVGQYTIELIGIESVVVPLNEYRARHFRITPDQGGDATELWVDLASGLPVRIRHRDRKGEVFDQLARELETKDLP